ncbi:MAG: ABC transporter permease [Spirochaetales bacterium]|nr:ABC transporter permease [Spirochaetales bacterium]
MTVCSTYLKRIFARRWTVVLTVAVPVLIALLGSTGGGDNRIRVALFDHDDSTLSRMVARAVAPVAVLVEIEYDRIDAGLADGRIEYAMVIPRGLESGMLRGEEARIRTYSLQGVEITAAIRTAADTVLSAARTVVPYVEGDRGAFVEAMMLVESGRFTARTETFRRARGALSATQATGVTQLIGILALTMLSMATVTCFMFLKDVEAGTLHRSLAGPVSVQRYMIEANLAFFLATSLQGIAAAVVIGVVFRDVSTGAILMLLLILTAFSLVAVSLSLAVANIAGTVRRTQVTVNFILIPMAMLGGTFWPVEIMPEFLQRVSDFTPVRWTTAATRAALSGAEFTEVAPHVGILLLFAVLFQAMSIWKKVDVAR